jgi:aminoglycoside N3'-acetyltransferase
MQAQLLSRQSKQPVKPQNRYRHTGKIEDTFQRRRQTRRARKFSHGRDSFHVFQANGSDPIRQLEDQ